VNREESKEIRDDMAACGFKEAFNLLWAVSNPDDTRYSSTQLRNVVCNEYHSNEWADVVARHAWFRYYNYQIGRYENNKREAKAAWDSIMQQLRKDCYEIVSTDVTVL
jgi:hypothetical protein